MNQIVNKPLKKIEDDDLYYIQSKVTMSILVAGVMSYEYFTSYDAMRKRIDDIEKHEAFYEIINHGKAWIENDRLCPHA